MKLSKFTIYLTVIIADLFFSALAVANDFFIIGSIILAAGYIILLSPDVQKELGREQED